ARRVGQDKFPAGRREISVGNVNRDALLALGSQAVGEEREVDWSGAAVLGSASNRMQLILVDRPGVVQQSPDQRALPIVHAAGRTDAQKARHQKYPSRFLSSIEPS